MTDRSYEIRETTREIYMLESIALSDDILPTKDHPGLSGNPRRFTYGREELECILAKAEEADSGPGVGHIEVDSELKKVLGITGKGLPKTVTIDHFLYHDKKDYNKTKGISFGEAAGLGFPRQIVITSVDSIKAYKKKK